MNFTLDKTTLQRKYKKGSFRYYLHLMARIIKRIYHTPHNDMMTSNDINHIPQGMFISIWGKNNHIWIDPSIETFHGNITIGDNNTTVDNCTLKIGEKCISNGINIVLYEPGSSVIIGKNCLFSFNIDIWASDSHSIFDKDTKKLLNWGKSIVIGDHVWVGMKSCILKNSHIANDCIVGAHSVVAGQFTESNCAIAGNPAKIVKRGISWDGLRPCEYQMKHNS